MILRLKYQFWHKNTNNYLDFQEFIEKVTKTAVWTEQVLKPSQIANRFVTLASNKILIHSFESQRLTGDIHIDGDASGCLSATLRWA